MFDNFRTVMVHHCLFLIIVACPYTLQEHQMILTNVTVSKHSDFGFIMEVYEKIFL